MSDTVYLHFESLDHPVALLGASALIPLIANILAGWQFRELATPSSDPFVTVRALPDGDWSLVTADDPQAERRWDDVNVICDLVSEMAWERLRSETHLLCLHAAAVDFGGRLVVMPNARRAGKSTLCVALARLGHSLFTDDVLPVEFDQISQTYRGIANGVAPRVRLPLPQTFSDVFRDWVEEDAGPSNGQYKYLVESAVGVGGATLPLGALVVLNRLDDPHKPTIKPIPREDALASLITQNFARTTHAGVIMNSTDRLTEHLPAFCLTYHSSEEAAEFLSACSELQQLPITRHGDQEQNHRPAPLDQPQQPGLRFDPSRKYLRVAGVTETMVGEDHFLVDGAGSTIHRLNPGSAVIWKLLAEPIDLDEIVAVVCAVFKDADPDQVMSDSEILMRNLAEAKLIGFNAT